MLGAAGKLEAGLEKRDRGIVIDGLGLEGLDDGDMVGDLPRVVQQFAEPGPGLPVAIEPEDGGGRWGNLSGRRSCR
jgi:hypothetical protein